jgi:hypothetical protein
MSRLYRNIARTVAISAAAFLVNSPAAASGMSIRSLAAQELRLATITYRIGASSANSCPRREMMTGMLLHDLSQYDPHVRPAISRAFSLNSGVGVLGVVPGSTAAAAGLQVDDEILSIGNVSVERHAAQHPGAKSYRRMEALSALLNANLASGRTDLRVRRRGEVLKLSLHGQASCGGQLTLVNSREKNAWADGRYVIVTTAMLELARSDDEVAFIIAHEMAHNILGHSHPTRRRNGIFGGISRVKKGEIEADSFAVHLMSGAGYRPLGGISFLQNARRRMWWNVSLDHPGFDRRIRVVSAAMHSRTQAKPSRPSGS